jgi:hypothetical protein
MSDDSINWNIWLPVVCTLSGVSAVCACGLVLYFYCRIRDNLSPAITSLSDFSYMRGANDYENTGTVIDTSGNQIMSESLDERRNAAHPPSSYALISFKKNKGSVGFDDDTNSVQGSIRSAAEFRTLGPIDLDENESYMRRNEDRNSQGDARISVRSRRLHERDHAPETRYPPRSQGSIYSTPTDNTGSLDLGQPSQPRIIQVGGGQNDSHMHIVTQEDGSQDVFV